jgi:hypothetical protein
MDWIECWRVRWSDWWLHRWLHRWFNRCLNRKGVLTIEAAIALPLLLMMGLGLAQYLGHLRAVEVTRQAFHNTCLQISVRDPATLHSPGGTSLAMAANLAAVDHRVDLQYLYLREDDKGNFVAKLYWVRRVPIIGYVVTSFEKTGRSIYMANDNPGEGDNSDKVSSLVFVTDTGSKYHEADCFHLRKSSREISQDEAELKGYEACAHCILEVPLFEKK